MQSLRSGSLFAGQRLYQQGLALCALGNSAAHLGQGVVVHQQRQLYLGLVQHLHQLGAMLVGNAAHHAFKGVGHLAFQRGVALHLDLLGVDQGLRNRIGVGAHQAAGAQFDAAVVAHHGGQHVLQVLVAQHVEHGAACGAAGLAVIYSRRVARGEQGPAHVHGAWVGAAQTSHNVRRLGAVAYGFYAAQKAAFFDEQIAANSMGQREGHS